MATHRMSCSELTMARSTTSVRLGDERRDNLAEAAAAEADRSSSAGRADVVWMTGSVAVATTLRVTEVNGLLATIRQRGWSRALGRSTT
jgi:hypothetical protein